MLSWREKLLEKTIFFPLCKWQVEVTIINIFKGKKAVNLLSILLPSLEELITESLGWMSLFPVASGYQELFSPVVE